MQTNNALVEFFQHNLWANLRLLDLCATLSDELLDASAPATYGTVRDTLVHLFGTEERYVAFLSEQPRRWPPREREPFPGIPDLRAQATRTGEALIGFAESFDAAQVLQVEFRGETTPLRAVIPLLQAINHATEHRLHIVSVLNQHGVETPPMDAWAYDD